MKITLTKKAAKPHVLRCLRDDGSETWFQASAGNADFFAAHDLSHYAIESTLHYTTAFYGMVAAGRDLNDFGSQNGEADTRGYSEQAMWAENMANLFLQCVRGKHDYKQFQELLDLTYGAKDERPPSVSEEQFNQISDLLRELLNRWSMTPAEDSLELMFSCAVTT